MSKELIDVLKNRDNTSPFVTFSYPIDNPKVIFKTKKINGALKRKIGLETVSAEISQAGRVLFYNENLFKQVLEYTDEWAVYSDSPVFEKFSQKAKDALNDELDAKEISDIANAYLTAEKEDEKNA